MQNIQVALSPEAEEVYDYLVEYAPRSKIERSILNAIHKKAELIQLDPEYGDKYSRKQIPREYVVKYGINNLFRVELPNRWRMLYSLMGENKQIEIIAFILDISDHDKYNKLFGYK